MLRLLRFHLIRGTFKRKAKADVERWLTWTGYAIWRHRQEIDERAKGAFP